MRLLAWTPVVLVGCDITVTQRFGSASELATPTGASGTTADTGPLLPTAETGTVPTTFDFDCVSFWANDLANQTVLGDTSNAPNQRRPTCNAGRGDDGPEVLVGFTAPEAGDYAFDLINATTKFDTVLAVLGSCAGPELACNDDALQTLQSRIEIPLAAGQQVVVVIDGFSEGSRGPFQLEIASTR